jgi:hypothetical protein
MGMWRVDIFAQKDENLPLDLFGRERFFMLR